jgi:hypothetical protein
MSKNLTRKSVALGTALAFIVSGFVFTAPAQAAPGDLVSLSPSVGTGYGVYNTDYLGLKAAVDADVFNSTAAAKLSIEIKNPDQKTLNLVVGQTLTVGSVCSDLSFKYVLVEDNGNMGGPVTVAATADADGDTASDDNQAACDAYTASAIAFTGAYKSIVIYEISGGPFAPVIRVNAVDSATATVHENVSMAVTAWIDSNTDREIGSTEGSISKTETVVFYDAANVVVTPRIERFSSTALSPLLNGDGAPALAVSMTFPPGLNLDQINLSASNFTFAASGGGETADAFSALNLAGNTTRSADGRIYGTVDGASFTLDEGDVYTFTVNRLNADTAGTGTKAFVTAGYTVPKQVTAGVTAVAGILVDQTSDSDQDGQTDSTIALRAGIKTFKYTMNSTAATGAVISNVPVIAEVKATDLARNATLTVGTSVLKEGQSILVSGVTDAKGNFSVSVTASAAAAGEIYDVEFSVLLNSGAYAFDEVQATYATAAATKMVQASDILAGANVSAKFTLTDQFGKAVSTKANGTPYTVRVQAPDTTKLRKYVTFSNGVATVDFANYLEKGQSDVLSVALGTGVDTAFATESITTGSTLSPSLYNPEDASAVTVAAAYVDKEITYDAFITGAEVAVTNVAPSTNGHIHTGTVVDTRGVGIPGAVVTVSGSGLQFVKSASGVASGDYFKESISVVADAAGTFEVTYFAQKVSAKGITITTTSGGKSAATKLTTIAADGITADELVLTWDAPKHPAVNTTYIITVKLTDLWGNPVSGAELDFSADGALTVNGGDSLTARKTNASGINRVYLRSLRNTDGVGSLTATLTSVEVGATLLDDSTELTGTTFSPVLEAELVTGTDATAKAGPKKGVVRVNAYNAKGQTVRVFVGGTLRATVNATKRNQLVRVTGLATGDRKVRVTVGGKRYLVSSVTVK